MDYLVSAEDNSYYHWQLELLIQSFRLHNQQDNLVIALAEDTGPQAIDFRKLLGTCPRVFSHENVGKKRGYRYLNRPYAVATALEQGILKQPFVVIEPDMVMFQPIRSVSSNVTIQVKPSFSLIAIEEQGFPSIRKFIPQVNNEYIWLPIGNVFAFKDVPNELFLRVISWAEKLAFESASLQEQANQPVTEPWKYLERAAWSCAIMDYYGQLTVDPVWNFEMHLMDHDLKNNFIHYTHGIPPVWNKKMFEYAPPDFLIGGGTPFDGLKENNPTTSTNYMQWVVNEYLAT